MTSVSKELVIELNMLFEVADIFDEAFAESKDSEEVVESSLSS